MTKPCPKCDGTGRVPDPSLIGGLLRDLRESAGLKQYEVAEKLGMSACYLSDLEHGKRDWNNALIKRFKLAVKSNGENRK